jgi:hypothetical protein
LFVGDQEEEDIGMVGKILREISNSDEALPGMLQVGKSKVGQDDLRKGGPMSLWVWCVQDGVMNIVFKLAKMDPGSIKVGTRTRLRQPTDSLSRVGGL